jgi:hypothetical protein
VDGRQSREQNGGRQKKTDTVAHRAHAHQQSVPHIAAAADPIVCRCADPRRGPDAAGGREGKDQKSGGKRMRDEDRRERPDRGCQAERQRSEQRAGRARAKLDAYREQRHARQRDEKARREHGEEIREPREAGERFGIAAEGAHHWPHRSHQWSGSQREPRRLVGVVVALEERDVASGKLEGIDVERVLVRDRANEIEP